MSDSTIPRFLEAQNCSTPAGPGVTAYENTLREIQNGNRLLLQRAFGNPLFLPA